MIQAQFSGTLPRPDTAKPLGGTIQQKKFRYNEGGLPPRKKESNGASLPLFTKVKPIGSTSHKQQQSRQSYFEQE